MYLVLLLPLLYAIPTCVSIERDRLSTEVLEAAMAAQRAETPPVAAALVIEAKGLGDGDGVLVSWQVGKRLTDSQLRSAEISIETPGNTWELTEFVAQGKTGIVYKGTDQNGRTVAVKVATLRPGAANELRAEAAFMRYLKDVAAVPTVHYFGHCQDRSILVMDFIGQNMRYVPVKLREKNGKGTLMTVAADFFDSLIDIHNHHIVHGDIKPLNLLWQDAPGRPRPLHIVDFGFSAFFRDPETRRVRFNEAASKSPTEGLGTRAYATSQALGDGVKTQRDDAISAFLSILSVDGKYDAVQKARRMENPMTFDRNMVQWLLTPRPHVADKVYLEIWHHLSSMRYGDEIPPAVPQLFRVRARELAMQYQVPRHAWYFPNPALFIFNSQTSALPKHIAKAKFLDLPRIQKDEQVWTLSSGLQTAPNMYRALSRERPPALVTLKFGQRLGRYKEPHYNEANFLHILQAGRIKWRHAVGVPRMIFFGELIERTCQKRGGKIRPSDPATVGE